MNQWVSNAKRDFRYQLGVNACLCDHNRFIWSPKWPLNVCSTAVLLITVWNFLIIICLECLILVLSSEYCPHWFEFHNLNDMLINVTWMLWLSSSGLCFCYLDVVLIIVWNIGEMSRRHCSGFSEHFGERRHPLDAFGDIFVLQTGNGERQFPIRHMMNGSSRHQIVAELQASDVHNHQVQ